ELSLRNLARHGLALILPLGLRPLALPFPLLLSGQPLSPSHVLLPRPLLSQPGLRGAFLLALPGRFRFLRLGGGPTLLRRPCLTGALFRLVTGMLGFLMLGVDLRQ